MPPASLENSQINNSWVDNALGPLNIEIEFLQIQYSQGTQLCGSQRYKPGVGFDSWISWGPGRRIELWNANSWEYRGCSIPKHCWSFSSSLLDSCFTWSRSVGRVHWLSEELKEPKHESKQSSALCVQMSSHCRDLHHLRPFIGFIYIICESCIHLWRQQGLEKQ